MTQVTKTTICFFLLFVLGMQCINAQQTANEFATKNPDKIFVGALMKPESMNGTEHQFVDATFHPITVSFSNLLIKSQEIVPSHDNMMNVVRQSIQAGNIKPNDMLSISTQELKSYDEIALYFGQSVDLPFYLGIKAGQTPKKTLVATHISQSFLTMDMDFVTPEELCSDKEVLAQADKLIYVSSVSCGRKAIILVESDFSYADVKKAMADVWENKMKSTTTPTLSRSEAILANAIIRVVIPQDPDFEVTTPDNPIGDVAKYINKEISADDFGKPILFRAAQLKDNAMFIYEVK